MSGGTNLLVTKYLVALGTFNRTAVGKRIISTANRPIVNTDVLIGSAGGNTMSSLSNNCALGGMGSNTILMFSCLNCHARRVPMGKGRIVGIALGRGSRILSRILIINCTINDGQAISNTISHVGGRSVGGKMMADPTRTLGNGITNIIVSRTNNSPADSPDVHIHKASSLSNNGSPLIVVSNIFTSVAVFGALTPNSVRDLAVLGSTSRATRCNSHNTSNIVIIAATGNGLKCSDLDCGNRFNMGAICGGLSVVSTSRCHRATGSLKLACASVNNSAGFLRRVRHGANLARGRGVSFSSNASASDLHTSLKFVLHRKTLGGSSVGGFATGLSNARCLFSGRLGLRLKVFNSRHGDGVRCSVRGVFCSTATCGPACPRMEGGGNR